MPSPFPRKSFNSKLRYSSCRTRSSIFQTSNDERMGVLVNLVQQNTDSVNKMTALINGLSADLKTQNDAGANTEHAVVHPGSGAQRLRSTSSRRVRQPRHATANHPGPDAECELADARADGERRSPGRAPVGAPSPDASLAPRRRRLLPWINFTRADYATTTRPSTPLRPLNSPR